MIKLGYKLFIYVDLLSFSGQAFNTKGQTVNTNWVDVLDLSGLVTDC